MRKLKQLVNFVALITIFDWMLGSDRPKEWLDGDVFFWQKGQK